MAENKIRMPSSMGGLVSYTSEYESKLTFKPAYVVVMIIVVMIIAILLHLYGKPLLGL